VSVKYTLTNLGELDALVKCRLVFIGDRGALEVFHDDDDLSLSKGQSQEMEIEFKSNPQCGGGSFSIGCGDLNDHELEAYKTHCTYNPTSGALEGCFTRVFGQDAFTHNSVDLGFIEPRPESSP